MRRALAFALCAGIGLGMNGYASGFAAAQATPAPPKAGHARKIPPRKKEAPSPCDRCAGRALEPIHVHLISADKRSDWIFNRAANADRDELHSKYCPECRLKEYTAQSRDELCVAIEEAAANCQQIKLFTIISHGNVGLAGFGTGDEKTFLTSSFVARELKPGLACAIAPDATFFFDGCQVSRGCRGEGLVTLLASRLLKKGGRIQGCYTYGDSVGGIVGLGSICLEPHTLEVGPGPGQARWLGGIEPKSGQDCRANIQNDLALLDRLWSEKGACNENLRELADSTRKELGESLALEDELGGNRTQFSPLQEKEAVALDQAYSDLDALLSDLKNAPSCSGSHSGDCPDCGPSKQPAPGESWLGRFLDIFK